MTAARGAYPAQPHCYFCPDFRFSLDCLGGRTALGGPLARSTDVYVTPDLSPVTSGHLLVVANRHARSFARFQTDGFGSHLDGVIGSIATMHWSEFKQATFVLEHGTGIDHLSPSCVDHAHIHVVPVPHATGRFALTGDGTASSISEALRSAPMDSSYLAFGLITPHTRFVTLSELAAGAPPQLTRRIIARVTGRPFTDWRSGVRSEQHAAFYNDTIARWASLGAKVRNLTRA